MVPLLQILRRYNENLALLWVVQAKAGDPLTGQVECLGPKFYRGHIDRLAPGENAHDFSFEGWAKLCRLVLRNEEAAG